MSGELARQFGPAICSMSVRRWGDFARRSILRAAFPMWHSPPAAASRPVLSLATDILAREPNSRFTLIYGNRSMARTMFLEDMLALKNRYLGPILGAFRHEPRAAADGIAQWAHRCGQGSRSGASR